MDFHPLPSLTEEHDKLMHFKFCITAATTDAACYYCEDQNKESEER